ncbi:Acyl-CoA N-acyltransferase [Niveomyces insectorum RCEF 264]|uniref:Acyl-CoA N-acyltransferase n=1 Tax=Niveomyces insectorum RCEF 264 TaxID=1081102 RepID=A0A167SKW3_9HYPO|nr:Acyl-CoA N-acyltransferase [Niveomyces insectorum RCEF 264]
MSTPTFKIRALTLEDVPAAAQLSADAFTTDRQTEMKGLGKKPFDMKKYTLDSMPVMLANPRCVVIKAVDDTNGDIMGYCTWGFRGIAPEEMPAVEGRAHSSRPPAPPPPPSPPATTAKSDAASEPTPEDETDPIQRLQALTNADMNAWMAEVMPEGARCLFVIGLAVAPAYQGRGVGRALLRWGTDVCDARGAFAWVHSSEPAWAMYAKSGFEVVRSLDVDLDEYAPMPPPNEGPDAKWGHYVFRYMKYLPKYL